MKIKYPDYKNSILSLASSVLAYYGAERTHETLSCFDKLLAKDFKNVVVMVFDGMGTKILEKHLCEDSFLRRNYKNTISSVFPPTTTAATTSLLTGYSPIEHGWLGWSLYFDKIGNNVNLFPNTLPNGTLAERYHVAQRYLQFTSIFDKISLATNNEVSAFIVSPFSDYKSESVYETCDIVKSLCAQNGRKYIYAYWPQPDYDIHDFGTMHKHITPIIQDINDQVERMCSLLSDTLVIVTADHGLVDTEWRFIPNYHDIVQCLKRMPSIESRAMTFFIKNGMCEDFVLAFNKHFGDCYLLIKKTNY